jgi:hypothetical protein
MGGAKVFENRRTELSILRNQPSAKISDQQVLDSIFYEIEFGCFRKYLEVGQLCCTIGNTLFVHGAISEISAGFVPSRLGRLTVGGGAISDGALELFSEPIQVWEQEMIAFKNTMLKECYDHLHQLELFSSNVRRPGESLLAYGFRPAMNYRTCIVDVFFDRNRNPIYPSEKTLRYLADNHISRVMVGHKPIGDHPFIIKTHLDTHPIEIVMADISYSAGNRRSDVAFQEIVIQGSFDYNQVEVNGRLHSGDVISYSLPNLGSTPSEENSTGDPFIGGRTSDGWWIKGLVLHNEQYVYILTQPNGRANLSKLLTSNELAICDIKYE